MAEQAFSCQRCGHCCQGEGGIVMTARDRERLAAHLGLEVPAMLARYAEEKAGKLRLRVGADGYCVFFDNGCGVHPGRPDICRAWPFFKGNLVDAMSWEMAQDYCPGIEAKAGHRAFVREGRDYMSANGLFHPEDPEAPEALKLSATQLDDGQE